MIKSGRPRVDNPKAIRFSIRLDKYTAELLEAYCVDRAITKGEAIRRGINLIGVRKELCSMNASEARKASEKGAINSIEEVIAKAVEKGITSIDLEGYDFYDAISDDVESYFENNGYRFDGSIIRW